MKEAKFTATMVFNADKVLVQALRDKLNVGEKELMNKLISFGLQHEAEIEAWAAEVNAEAEAEKIEHSTVAAAAEGLPLKREAAGLGRTGCLVVVWRQKETQRGSDGSQSGPGHSASQRVF